MQHQTGDIIYGHYNIIRFIARGAFGETYEVEDLQSPRANPICLLKYLKPLINSPAVLEIALQKFRDEANVLRRLGSHNQIPELYDDFEENQKFYLVEEYIDGENLEQVRKNIEEKVFTETEVINILNDVLQVLDYLSEQKVIHRDIKPANLIMRKEDRKIVVVDFGAVKESSTLLINEKGQTVSTMVIGTPNYMPDEQLRGKPTFASDIYALGITAIELLTGQIPEENPEGEKSWNRLKCSPYFVKIIDKMVRQKLQHRYEKAAEVLADLEAISILGQTLNQRYHIKSYLGGEGFSHTYLASDLQRPYKPECIIKQLRIKSDSQKILQSVQIHFASAIQTTEELLHHQQIRRAIDHFQANQDFYLVYEYVEGEAISTSLVSGNCLSEAEVIALLKDVLNVLCFIHVNNIIHGNIKPSNLILRQKDHKITMLDFAMFKPIVTLQVNSGEVNVKSGGTDGYMAPEQIQNQSIFASDIYALGMTAIQALTGIPPEQLPKNSQDEVVWQNQAQVSRKFAKILNKMVRSQIKQRYQSAQQVINDLNASSLWEKIEQHRRIFLIAGITSIISFAYIGHKMFQQEQAEKLFDKGVDLTKQGQLREAIAIYDEAIAIVPKFTEALVNKGYIYGKLNNPTQQFYVCTQATQNDPNSSIAWLCIGNAQVLSKQYDDSIKYFEKVINLNCNYNDDKLDTFCADGWGNKGESLLYLNKFDEALNASEKAIIKNKKSHFSWTLKGKTLFNLKRYQEAVEAYDKALEIKPDYQPAINGRKEALKLWGR
jgi:eukaryotic-like serine/threonine-protein kinase